MSDNIYKALFGDNAPFGGMANINYFDRTIKGQIENVHYEDLFVSDGKNQILNQNNYRTVDIKWLEGKPYTSTNVHIPELISYKGYGLNYLPSKGDIVYASFDSSNNPVITSVVARCSVYEHGVLNPEQNLPSLNKYGDPLLDTVIPSDIRPTPIRYIKEGEISLISKNFAELYLDKEGAAKLITRQVLGGQQMGNRLFELSLGEKIIDEGTGKIKKDFKGNNINFQILGHQNGFKQNIGGDGSFQIQNNGWNIICDTENKLTIKNDNGDILTIDNGKINFLNSQGDSIEIADGKIKVGTNAIEPMVLGNTLTQFMTTIIGIFNGHTHLYAPGPGTPTPTAPPTAPMILQDFLSKKVFVE